MFLTKDDFITSLDVLNAYEEISGEQDISFVILEKYAKQLFDDYDHMSDADRDQIIEMLRQDISIKLYSIN
jgi:hypothetical protein